MDSLLASQIKEEQTKWSVLLERTKEVVKFLLNEALCFVVAMKKLVS